MRIQLIAVALAATAAWIPNVASERQISRAQYGDKWPFTVDSGSLMSVGGSSVLFRSGTTTYALNGRARGQKRWAEADPIVRTKELAAGQYEPVKHLPEATRRTIFAEGVACEDRGDKTAERETTDLKRQASISRRVSEACKTDLRKRRALTSREVSMVSTEGMSKGWPPLSPFRMPLSDLIADGLKLCAR